MYQGPYFTKDPKDHYLANLPNPLDKRTPLRLSRLTLCRPMISQPHPFKGLNITIPIIIPIKGRGFINHGSALGVKAQDSGFKVSTELCCSRHARLGSIVHVVKVAWNVSCLQPFRQCMVQKEKQG